MGFGHRPAANKTTIFDLDALCRVVEHVGFDGFVDQLISRLTDAFEEFDQNTTHSQIRTGFSYETPRLGLVEWMPVHAVGDVVAVKTVGYHPANPAERNLPSVLATTAIYDTTNGALIALCEATLLTALRTGAASAIMTDRLVPEGEISLGVVGCGAQAVTQIHAISRLRDLKRVFVTDTQESTAASLQSRLPSGLCDVTIVPPEQFAAVVTELDVICTCTSVDPGRGPVVDLSGASQSLHVNAVGSDFPGKTELPTSFLTSAVVVPDLIEQCLVEGEAQALTRDAVGPSIVEVLANSAEHKGLANRRTVFDSTGWSYEDLIAAELFIEHARSLGLGIEIALGPRAGDPFDPLAGLKTPSSISN